MSAALHWGSERDRRRPFAVEWLYFKFFTPTVDGIVVYGCGWGMPGVMSAEVFRHHGGSFAPPTRVVRHDYDRDEVWRATTSFDCRVGGCTVASDGGDLVAVGAVAADGHAIDWQLRVAPRFPAFASFTGPGGWLPGGSLHWYLLAPLATVTGRVLVDGVEVPVDGSGYVDSNGGRWLFALDPTTHWNWAMVFDRSGGDDLVAVGMSLRHRPQEGGFHLRSGLLSCDFPCYERTFEHLAFGEDPETGTLLPTTTRVRADDGAGTRLELLLENEWAHVYRQAIPPRPLRGPLPTCVEWQLAECFVRATGTLSWPGGSRAIEARGIKEYPVTRLVRWE